MRLLCGICLEQYKDAGVEAREIAAKYPGDADVLSALAEAEYDAGNNPEAIAAADRAIAIDASQKNAYVQKGYALFREARDAEDSDLDAAYAKAMEPFQALNALENDHPLPLIYYYRSFVQRGQRPEENARAALERASQLAPFDQSLRLNVAVMLISEGKNSIARQVLGPLAADPHGSRRSARAKHLIALLEQAPDGAPVDIAQARDDSGDADQRSDGGNEGEE
ncbi:MAG: hypothetical protein QNJ15_00460 [Erythrobacter sp.]|nr:hypothetical protein [Erythrobacter sp.]